MNIAGIVTTGFIPILFWSKEDVRGMISNENNKNVALDLPIPQNTITTILEMKIICVEHGKFFGQGTEYAFNTNGHVFVKKRITEPDRYLGWLTIECTHDVKLIVAF